MSDITTVWDPATGRGDYQLSGADLLSGDDLQTAVLISLFTDRQSAPDDIIPDGTQDPRGWWGDQGEQYPIGSRLWLLDRAKQETEVLNLAQDYITEALQWLIDDGVAARIAVHCEWTGLSVLGAQIEIYRQDGSRVALNYAWAWKGVS